MDIDPIDAAMHHVTWPESRTQIPQVRIEVNFKCGKACFYCRPTGEGIAVRDLEKVAVRPVLEMTVDELVAVVTVLARHGISDLKLTGGDPMLRADIVEIVRRVKAVPGVSTVHLVTRHHSAGQLAPALKDAGLDLLNFSLDSMDSVTWTKITRVRGHERLIGAVRAAASCGIPIKLNTVVLKGVNDHEIPALVEFAGEIGAELKLLDLINDIGVFPGFDQPSVHRYYADLVPIAKQLAACSERMEVVSQPGGLGHPMPRFWMPNGAVVTVKSARFGAYYGAVCRGCQYFPCWDALMALRITPNGMLQYCLLRSDNLVDLLGLVHSTQPLDADRAIEEVLRVYRQAMPWNGNDIVKLRSTLHPEVLAAVARGPEATKMSP